MMDRNTSSHGEPNSVRELSSLEEAVELKNFGSDHAVDPRAPEASSSSQKRSDNKNKDIPMAAVVRRPSTRNSLYWGDLITPNGRRGSSSLYGSSVSSLTLTDFGGDSFFADSFYNTGSQRTMWGLEPTVVEDEEEETALDSSADTLPVCPMRRDSISSGKISTSTRRMMYRDLGSASPSSSSSLSSSSKRLEQTSPKRLSNTSSELPPMKPGRRASIAPPRMNRRSMLLMDRNPIIPGRQESAATLVVESSSTSSRDVSMGASSASSTTTGGDDSTLSSAHNPCLLRSEGKRKLFS